MNHRVLAALALVAAASGCSCDQRTNKRYPTLQVIDADGNDRSAVDFGQVQLATTGTQKLRLRNSGSAALNISEASFSNPLFGLADPLPLVVDIGTDVDATLTFKPTTADQRVTGTVTFTTDDPAHPTAQLSLAGTGVTAVGVLNPTTVDFGDVFVTENKKLGVTLTNAGSNDLVVTQARFTSAVPTSVTTDLASLATTLKAGAAVTAQLTFAPTQQVDVAGALEFVLGGGLGTLSVPLKGHGVQALPRLCFKYDDSALESCTDQTTTSLTVNFGKFCDANLFPPDGGASTCLLVDGGTPGYGRTAKLYFRNEGNTPVAYSLQYDSKKGTGCDGGSSIDFVFSNAPHLADGGLQPSWTEATVKLPNAATDPKPWETAPVSLSYAPRSRCLNDAADSAQLVWSRQGEPLGTNRPPSTLLLLLSGGSMLPNGQPQDISLTGSLPVTEDVLGVNKGDAPLTITGATLMQGALLTLADGGTSRGLTPGEVCTPSSTDACAVFAWAAGANPNASLPVRLPGTTDQAVPVTKLLGKITFGGPDAGVPQSGRVYTVFAVLQTDDPYRPQVVSTFRATGP